MADLSLESVALDFEASLDTLLSDMIHMTTKLPDMHRSINSYASNYSRYSRPDYPVKETFDVAFSMALALLLNVVRAIKEAEDMVETLLDDEEADMEELNQAQGELYGAKKMYLDLVPVIGAVETSRLQSTAGGMPAGDFMTLIGRNKGVPVWDKSYTRGMPQIITKAENRDVGPYHASGKMTFMVQPPAKPF